MDGSNLTH